MRFASPGRSVPEAVRIALSTSLYLNQRLTGTHVAQLAAAGFRAIELVALRTHFDYRDPAALDELVGWLEATGVDVDSLHAPIADGYAHGTYTKPFSVASPDPARRQCALDEIEAALALAERLRFKHLVLHLGGESGEASGAGDAEPEAARRSLAALDDRAAALGVTLAVENLGNRLSSVERLVETIEALELSATGLCLDFGQAHRADGVPDAIEAASGHLVSAHVYDVKGTDRRHLVPLQGEVDWPGSMMALQKIGYEGRLVFDLDPVAPTADVLAQAGRACSKLESHFVR